MKFKLKALAVAVAMAAVAGQASAAVPNADAVLFVWDSAAGSSFVQDLGLASLFNPANVGTQTFTVGGSNWTSFTGQATYAADLAAGNVTWGIVASPSQVNFITTLGLGQTAVAPSAANAASINTAFNTLTNAITGTSTSFSAGPGFENWNTSLKDKLSSNVNFLTNNLIGATGVAMANFDVPTGRGAVPTITPFQQVAAFNGSTLTVAAVPEPETYGMLAAGLLMLGAVARRRRG